MISEQWFCSLVNVAREHWQEKKWWTHTKKERKKLHSRLNYIHSHRHCRYYHYRTTTTGKKSLLDCYEWMQCLLYTHTDDTCIQNFLKSMKYECTDEKKIKVNLNLICNVTIHDTNQNDSLNLVNESVNSQKPTTIMIIKMSINIYFIEMFFVFRFVYN